MRLGALVCCFGLSFAHDLAFAWEANPPQTIISNGLVRARVYLPDPERGYYRGARFDWSGLIANLDYKGHSFFGVWFSKYSPTINDAVTGPVEEFRTGDGPRGSALGFDEAKPPRGLFIKIGVGVLRKPDDAPYSFGRAYDIVSPGVWTSRPEADRVEFEQDLTDGEGYAYRYEKTVRLVAKQPALILEHRLRNTGRKVIETDVYDHDFYVIDGMPTGPDFAVKFGFPAKASGDFRGFARLDGKTLVYTRVLEPGQTATSEIAGFSASPKENDIRVENRKTGAGVHETGDHPLVDLNFWSIRSTICPEAYIHLKIEPGHEAKWKIRYDFYTLTSRDE
jgi:hypothetical protein